MSPSFSELRQPLKRTLNVKLLLRTTTSLSLSFNVFIVSICPYTTFILCWFFSYIVNFYIFNFYFTISMCFSVACVGANTWIKLHIWMVITIKGFNRLWLSCKKINGRRVFTMRFLLVPQNIGQKILFLLTLHRLKQKLIHRQHKRRKKRQEKKKCNTEEDTREDWNSSRTCCKKFRGTSYIVSRI